jgi:hypothetical protein
MDDGSVKAAAAPLIPSHNREGQAWGDVLRRKPSADEADPDTPSESLLVARSTPVLVVFKRLGPSLAPIRWIWD